MTDVEMNPDEVRKTGEKYYPDLADIYGDTWKSMNDVSESIDIPAQSALESSLRNYTSMVGYYLRVSEFRLNSCGDTLVALADDLGKVDKDAAERIGNPVEGIVQSEEERQP